MPEVTETWKKVADLVLAPQELGTCSIPVDILVLPSKYLWNMSIPDLSFQDKEERCVILVPLTRHGYLVHGKEGKQLSNTNVSCISLE
jgi:hypothetical protein